MATSDSAVARVAVVACTKAKLRRRAPAIEMYSPSPLFQKSCDQARAEGLPIVILSTKYGLVDAQEVIDPYERTFAAMTPTERQEWDRLVADQVATLCEGQSLKEVVFFAGTEYRNSVQPLFAARGVATRVHPRWRAICDEVFGG